MANIKRLKRLVKVLERVRSDPKKKRAFNLAVWADEIDECGTHMCACGWGATDPVLNKQGLGLKKDRWATNIWGHKISTITFKRFVGDAAAEKFFDLTNEQAFYLFMPEAYANKTSIGPVIRRLRGVIANPDRRPPPKHRI